MEASAVSGGCTRKEETVTVFFLPCSVRVLVPQRASRWQRLAPNCCGDGKKGFCFSFSFHFYLKTETQPRSSASSKTLTRWLLRLLPPPFPQPIGSSRGRVRRCCCCFQLLLTSERHLLLRRFFLGEQEGGMKVEGAGVH